MSEKKAHKQIFALGKPGDGFNVRGMHCKEKCNDCGTA